jgi:hypothetical protein
MREVQQLVYDGAKLICPNHPNQRLEEGLTSSENGSFSVVCTAQVAEHSNCMRSAQWPTRADMERELAAG